MASSAAGATNHKDIGTLYLILAVIGGLVGLLMSVAIRSELMHPGISVFPGLAQMIYGADPSMAVDAGKNLYNVFITAHADIWNLGNTPFAREERYELLVQGGISVEDCQHIERAIRGGWVLGDDTFIEHMQSLAHRRVAKAKAGRPRLHQAVA